MLHATAAHNIKHTLKENEKEQVEKGTSKMNLYAQKGIMIKRAKYFLNLNKWNFIW